MIAVGDPVGTGIVPSLARRGGNITGLIPTVGISDSSCPRLSRASTSYKPWNIKDVDGRDEPGHDDVDGS